ncbi:hypothetical protein [Kibdelosporangium aridum]|uniref:hypothetical protein n=1 Tax=Kibdelosporangium aridum TaxID=2030 RepID=UPI000A8039F9|nr:hypothetical protein [Kibdelosporangium aridum]
MTGQPHAKKRHYALTVGSIGAAVLAIAAVMVGFTEQQAAGEVGGTNCGSVLGGGGADDMTAAGAATCEWALSTEVRWTWLLLVAAGVFLVVGLILRSVQRLESRDA